MRKAKNIFANIDKISILFFLLLICFGWISIYASQYNDDISFSIDLTSRYGKQFLFILVACFVAFLTLIIDWKFYYSLSYLFYISILLLLIIVLFKGNIVGGSSSWFELGAFKFQPSEFAKFTTGLALAKYYNNIHFKQISFLAKTKAYGIIILPFLLIILQNDLGTALVFTAFALVLYREGLSGNILIFGIAIGILFIITLLIEKLTLIFILTVIMIILATLLRKKKNEIFALLSVFIISISFVFSVNYIFNEVLAPHQRTRINVLLG